MRSRKVVHHVFGECYEITKLFDSVKESPKGCFLVCTARKGCVEMHPIGRIKDVQEFVKDKKRVFTVRYYRRREE